MNSIPVTIRFTSDWGVGTGVGYAGGANSVVEVDENNQPVVRGTVVTGVIREQALIVARALDGGRKGKWHDFIGSLFGGAPNFGDTDEDCDLSDSADQSDNPNASADQTVPRAIIFSDARICKEVKTTRDGEADAETDAKVPGDGKPDGNTGGPEDESIGKITEVVSVSIDEKTGTAKPDHFRIIERAPACVLKGRVDFIDSAKWDDAQVKNAKFVLALAGTLVPAIGSEKTNGDGRCEITVGDFLDEGKHAAGNEDGSSADSGEDDSACSDEDAGRPLSPVEKQAKAVHAACKRRLQEKLDSLPKAPAPVQVGAPGKPPCIASAEDTDPSKQADQQGQAEPKGKADRQQADGRADSPSYRSFDLNIELKTPVVSYEVPMSNEVRSLDFLRGTVVLAWVHSRLRAKFPADKTIRDAVVNGELFVSDATACVAGVRGRPVPMVFSYPKVDSGERSDVSRPSDGGMSPDGSSPSDGGTSSEISAPGDEPSTSQSGKSTGNPGLVKGQPGQAKSEPGKVKGAPSKPASSRNTPTDRTNRPVRELWNRLISKEPEDVHVPVRSGYIFDFGEDEPGRLQYGTGAPPVIGRQSTAHDAVRGTAKDGQLFLVRALAAGLTLQSTVTITESLYKHRPMVTKKTAAKNLHEHRSGAQQNEIQQTSQRTLGEMLPEILQGQARLGSRRLTGTFGLAACTTTEKPASNGAGTDIHVHANSDDNANTGNTDGWDSEGATTIWFTSDLLLRSPSLGAAGSSSDIIDAFNRSNAFNSANVRIKPFSPEKARKDGAAASKQDANNGITPPKQDTSTSSSKRDARTASSKHGASNLEGDHRYRAGLRYRRVDSWSAAEGQPRATRLAVQAGSVLKVYLGDSAEKRRKTLAALRELATVGIGELRAQGYGRFVVGDPLLSIGDNDGKKLHVQLLQSNDFLSDEK